MVLSMSKWVGKVAVVTGASSGIGKEIARELVRQGVTLVWQDEFTLIEELAKETRNEKGKLYALKCDVQLEEDVVNVFKWITDNLSEPVYIMINNAGVFGHTNLIDGDANIWKNVLDTNVFGLCLGTREAVRNMRANNVEGHIIHINSIGGHVIPYFYSSNVYPASKHAVTALTETIRREFAANKVNIKITSISPGIVNTDIVKDYGKMQAIMEQSPALISEDVVDAVIYALSTPPNVQVHDIILKPLHEHH
ncbi:hypothetical protein NQ317_016174 [Molorchus minor]|uniref:Farnesol dehydrogenase n=1 Tax=Molorchus minor TaxID=1323400 RepID=A0ABQ9JT17_9CUCU|nr:hypothetical protein NQ317_016174 [Molorchus minor]